MDISNAEMKNFQPEHPPSKLHDGDLSNFALSSPEQDGMWVRVNLKELYQITKIVVYNRISSFRDRIIGASIFIKSGDYLVANCGKIESTRYAYSFHCSLEGDGVDIRQDGAVEEWNIAEVLVYGKPINQQTGKLAIMFYFSDTEDSTATTSEVTNTNSEHVK